MYLFDTPFPILQVSAALDALVNIADGRINIHVLMALAAFASIFMGNALEGGLLLAMFNLAHIGTFLLITSESPMC
jgi:Zn2+/Cd2+-exporting ATPase